MSQEYSSSLPATRQREGEKEWTRKLRDDVRENILTLHGFIMVLALGNAVRELAVSHSTYLNQNPDAVAPLLSSDVLVSFFIGLVFIFRFFLGDSLYIKRYEPNNMMLFVIDMLNIFISALLIAYLSFFVTSPIYMFLIATVLIFSEVVWWLARSAVAWIVHMRDGDHPNIPPDEKLGINVGTFIAIVTLVLIVVRCKVADIDFGWNPIQWLPALSKLYVQEELWWLIGIFLFNTVFDLLLKGPSYFGSPYQWKLMLKKTK